MSASEAVGRLPVPGGAYEPARVAKGEIVYLSGQTANDPATGKLVEGGVAEQVLQVLKNLQAILASEGLGFDDVVKASVFMADMAISRR